MNLRIAVIFTLFFSQFSNALLRLDAGLGFTNNANFEEKNPNSDFYFLTRGISSFGNNDSYSAWASYRVYMRENQNDAIHWRVGNISDAKKLNLKMWYFDFGIGGQHFTGGSPATTEENFNNIYVDTSLSRSFQIKPKMELTIEPGYQLKSYTSLENRFDNKLFFATYMYLNFSRDQYLSPYIDFGIIASNDSIYSRQYFEIGIDWTWRQNRKTSFGATYYVRSTTYPNRTVSTETIVSNNRNSFQTITADESETHMLTALSGYYSRHLKNLELKAEVDITSQTSKSGFENFNVLGLKGIVQYNF